MKFAIGILKQRGEKWLADAGHSRENPQRGPLQRTPRAQFGVSMLSRRDTQKWYGKKVELSYTISGGAS